MNANRRTALRATLGLAAAPIVLAQGCTSPRAVSYLAAGKETDGNPSLRYLKLLSEGARTHGLPEHWSGISRESRMPNDRYARSLEQSAPPGRP